MEEKNLKTKKRKILRGILKVLLVLVLLGFVIAILKIAPNYKNTDITGKTNVVINNNNITAHLKNDVYIENENIYMSKPDLENFFDPDIYYEENYNQIITTYETNIANLYIGENKMNVAVLTAGGIGSRAHQDLPKQFLTVENKPILIYTLEAFQQHPSIDEIYVSCLDGWSAVLEAYAKQFNITKLKRIVTGGATGQESIYNGLKAIKEDNEETKDIVVIIHDGNRPMLPQDVITDNLVKQKLFGSAVTVIPTTEVVFVSKDGEESNVALNREELWRTQTPHSYRFDELWTVHNQAIEDGVINMAASCLLMQKYGYTTYFSKGSEKNIKITTVEDIEIFKALLSAKNDEWIKK